GTTAHARPSNLPCPPSAPRTFGMLTALCIASHLPIRAMNRFLLTTCVVFGFRATLGADEPKPLKLLFLGDNGHHRPNDRFRQLQPVLAKRGIAVEYTDKADALNPATLARYDGLIVYANIDEISPKQESALLEFVASGKG